MPSLDIGAGVSPHGTVNLDKDKQRYRELWKKLPGHSWIFAVGEHLPFQNDSFETVYCMVTLPYVKSEHKILRESHRVLKTAGKLLIKHHSLLYYLRDLINPSKRVLKKLLWLLLTKTRFAKWTFQTPKALKKQLEACGFNTYCYLERRFIYCKATKT